MMAGIPKNASPSRVEFGLFVLSILVIAGAWAAFVPNGQVVDRPQTEVLTIAEAGDSGKQALLGLVYLLNIGLLLRSTRMRDWRFVGWPLAGLMVWCLASAAWSVIPDGTIRRAVAMLGTLAVGLYAGQRFNEIGVSAALTVAAAIAAAGSLAWGLAMPGHGFDTDGNLRGLFYHKNAFGSFLALALLAIVFRMAVLRQRAPHYLALLALYLLVFVLVRSATPIVGILAGLGALFVAHLARNSDGAVQVILPTSLAITAALFLVFHDDLSAITAEMLGRDASLSGRTAIWSFVLPMIGANPWHGYGYGIFWLGEDAPGALFWYWSKQFELHSHDGYLQLLLDTGVVGLALFLTAIGALVVRSVRLNASGRWSLGLWVAMFLGFFLVCNITDTDLWQANSLLSTLLIWAVVRTNLESARTVRRDIGGVRGGVPAMAGV